MQKFYLFLAAIISLSSCSDDRKLVNIALTKQDKTYLFSLTGKTIAEHQLKKGETPTVMKSTYIIPEGKELYMLAADIDIVANIVGGNYVLIDKPETSYDGYVVLGEYKLVEKKYENKDSGTIGHMIGLMKMTLTHPANIKQHEIVWQLTPELKAVKNCIQKEIMMRRSIPNDTETYVNVDQALVNIQDILDFYETNAKLNYDEEAGLLYINMRD